MEICSLDLTSKQMQDAMFLYGLTPSNVSEIRQNPIFHMSLESLTLDDIKHFSSCGAHIRDETTKVGQPTHVLDAADVLKIALRSRKAVATKFVEDYADIFK
jgi:hypothetical protein